jgi:hypothetical protein
VARGCGVRRHHDLAHYRRTRLYLFPVSSRFLLIGAALSIKKGKIKRLDIEELEVGSLCVTELVVEQERRQGAP